jgi:AcrR family transcriptional regulator
MARKVGLSCADVVDAASRVADAEGLEAVTLASVAARLGIRSPSLYAHVEGLEGLKRLLAVRAAGEMAEALRRAAANDSGLGALQEIARAYRRFAKQHPGLYDAAQRAVRPGEDEVLYSALATAALPAIRALEEAGIDGAERIHLTRAMRSALHGFVALERIGGFGMPQSIDESFRRLVDLLLAGVRNAAAQQAVERRNRERTTGRGKH